MEQETISKDLGEEILFLIEEIKLKLEKRNLEGKNEEECSAPHSN